MLINAKTHYVPTNIIYDCIWVYITMIATILKNTFVVITALVLYLLGSYQLLNRKNETVTIFLSWNVDIYVITELSSSN